MFRFIMSTMKAVSERKMEFIKRPKIWK